MTCNSKHAFYHMHLQVDWAALLISFRFGSSPCFQIRSSTGSFPLSEMSRLPLAESSHGRGRMLPCASSYMPAPSSRGRDSPSISSENCKVKWQKWLISERMKKWNQLVTIPWAMCNIQDSVQSLSRVRLFATPWIAARRASLSITNSRSSLRLTSIESVMPSSHLILCRPLLLLPPIPFSIRVFSNESTLRMRWPKYWSFSFSIIPSKEIPGLISFRMDWLDLWTIQKKF